VKLKQDIHDRRLTHTELCSQPGYTHTHSRSWDTRAQGRVRTIGRIWRWEKQRPGKLRPVQRGREPPPQTRGRWGRSPALPVEHKEMAFVWATNRSKI